MRQLGVPEELVNPLSLFDSRQARYVEPEGVVDPNPIEPAIGFPQGDPCFPVRFVVIMAAWSAYITSRVPECNVAADLDDRVLWCTGDGAI